MGVDIRDRDVAARPGDVARHILLADLGSARRPGHDSRADEQGRRRHINRQLVDATDRGGGGAVLAFGAGTARDAQFVEHRVGRRRPAGAAADPERRP